MKFSPSYSLKGLDPKSLKLYSSLSPRGYKLSSPEEYSPMPLLLELQGVSKPVCDMVIRTCCSKEVIKGGEAPLDWHKSLV